MCVLPLPEHKPWNGHQPDVHLCWDGQIWAPSDYGIKAPVEERNPGRFGSKLSAFKQGEDRRQRFLEIVQETGIIKSACEGVGIHKSTYTKWRKKYPRFAAEVDLARDITVSDRNAFDVDFATFRRLYLKTETTWFQMQAVTALEECQEGEVILMLWPPEHGKTTTIEDFCNYKLALAPQTRITVVSEKQGHSKKILRRVKGRMEPDGPFPLYVSTFGPFVPDEATGTRAIPQPWANDYFDVRQRGKFDERDYSMVATGITTGVQGTRADWLIIDDIQSLKSLGQTESYVDILRQDFFSRPGIKGRICILGTRVGNLDVYEKLIEEGLIDKVIIFPAFTTDLDGTVHWLWPEAYTPLQYEKMRKRVGEQAWFRNFMQRPSAAKDASFSEEITDPCLNPTRSVIADCPQERDDDGNLTVTTVAVCVDPALGGTNSITALGFGRKKLYYLSSRRDDALTRNEQIFDAIEQTIIRWNQPGVSKVTQLIIEENNFQKGLLDDDRMRELIARYGLRVLGHTTGINKYDENIGIPSMALSFMRGEIDLPYSDKPSMDEVALFLGELYAWRPYKRGNRLRQDRVMSFWFGWIRWRGRKAAVNVDPNQFKSKGSPLRRSA